MQVWQLIGIIILSSLATCGIRLSMGKGMILAGFRAFVKDLSITRYIKKPIALCVTCMASFYGIPIYWYISLLVHGNNAITILTIPFALPVMGALNWYIMRDYYDDE